MVCRSAIGITAVAAVCVALAIAAVRYRWLANYVRRQPSTRSGSTQWTDRGGVPLGEKRYTPQGITWVDGRLIFANTWKNARSRVYEIAPDTMEIVRWFDMPPEAVHTSGLAWDRAHLWCVDYKSNRAYCVDLEESLRSGNARVVGSFDTGLKGTSACCWFLLDGIGVLAISDFLQSRTTIVVDAARALASGSAQNEILFDYHNEGFSQGLEFVDGFVYESENKAGIDIINKLDLGLLRKTRDSRASTVKQFNGPAPMIEDLAWDGLGFWTSDEQTFRFYRGVLTE